MDYFQMRDGFLRALRVSSNQVVISQAKDDTKRIGPYKALICKGSSDQESTFFFDKDAVICAGDSLQVVGNVAIWDAVSVIDQVINGNFIQKIVLSKEPAEISQRSLSLSEKKSKEYRAPSWHPRVYEVAKTYMENSMYRAAITDTFIALDKYTQEQSGVLQNGTSLMQSVFSAKNPVLRVSDHEEEQAGFMMLFTGAIKGIRNRYAHSLDQPHSAEEAEEWLAFASALFRTIDMAVKSNATSQKQ